MITRVHISLPVRDLDASVAFYERLFAQPVTKRRPGYANFRLDAPPIHLALEAHAGKLDGVSANHSHFGIELPDAESFAAWRDRLRDAGAGSREENDTVCCYAKADKVWLADADGNEWEVWVRKGESERMRSSESDCCAAECCAA